MSPVDMPDDQHRTSEASQAFTPTPPLRFVALCLLIAALAFHLFRQFAPLFQQVLMALFILYLVAPIYNWLRHRGVSKYLAYGIIFTTSTLMFLLVGTLLIHSLGQLEFLTGDYHRKLNALIDKLSGSLPFIDGEFLKSSIGQEQLWEQGRDWLESSVGTAFSVMGHVAMVTIFLIFLIIEQGSLPERLRAGLGPELADRHLQALKKLNVSVSAYVSVKTLTSIIVGSATTAILYAFGVSGALVWGVLAFLLNYIPYLGPIAAATLPGLFAIVELPNLWHGVLVLLSLHLTQGAVGNILDPLLLGRRLNLSPTMTLVFMVLWGSVWGITGMIVSVPLLVVTQIVLDGFDATRPLAVLLQQNAQAPETHGEK